MSDQTKELTRRDTVKMLLMGGAALPMRCTVWTLDGRAKTGPPESATRSIEGPGTAAGPRQTSTEPFIGEIRLVPYTFAPRGWVFCEGQLLPISEYQTLFSLLGTQYGGDGRTTFALPDLRRLEKDQRRRNEGLAFRHVMAVTGIYPSRI